MVKRTMTDSSRLYPLLPFIVIQIFPDVLFWAASKTISPWLIWTKKKKKKETIFREVLRLLLISASEYSKGREIDPFISNWNLWNILPRVSMSQKDHSRKRLEKRLQSHNWGASCSGTWHQLLAKMEKCISLISRFRRRQINSQQRHLIAITWKTLLYLFINSCLFVF